MLKHHYNVSSLATSSSLVKWWKYYVLDTLLFLKEVSYTHKDYLFDQKYTRNCNIEL